MNTNSFTLNQISDIAQNIISEFPKERFFCFFGSMGAGKTTLIQAICNYLESEDEASSPTFSIVHRYIGKDHDIFHFDFYRIEDPYEAINIGIEEYFNSGEYCFIEWPERIEKFLPETFVKVEIGILDENRRIIKAKKVTNKAK